MKTYQVTVQAKVVKTLEVEAPSQEEAEAVAHEMFTASHDGSPEQYNQETHNIKTL